MWSGLQSGHFFCLLLLVTDSDWRFLVCVGSNKPAQNHGCFWLTHPGLLQDLRTDSPGALSPTLCVVLVFVRWIALRQRLSAKAVVNMCI
jgi:hypothetical protein